MDAAITDKPSVKPIQPNTSPIRLTKPTVRLLRILVTKCNKKPHGRKVKADDVIQKALALLDDSHLDDIKKSTYSSQDHLEIKFKKYCQAHGPITKDQFLAILLTNALPQVSTPANSNQEST